MKKLFIICFLFGTTFISSNKVQAQDTPILGEVIMFAGNFAPRGWAFCDGQLLSIAQNTALFSILGTTYGGDGITTFGLPDLRSRVAIGEGRGPGLSDRSLGQKGGVESVILTVPQIPSHGHVTVLKASDVGGDEEDPSNVLSLSAGKEIYTDSAPNVQLNPASIQSGNTGGNLPHTNVQPFMTINYIIALQGIFPSRS